MKMLRELQSGVDIKQFFSAACAEIELEDQILTELFRSRSIYSGFVSHGLYPVFEHEYVYLALKGCLRSGYRYRISWEHSYAGKRDHIDIAIMEGDQPLAGIEFKVLTPGNYGKVEQDIQKLTGFAANEKYLFVVSYENETKGILERLGKEHEGSILLAGEHSFRTNVMNTSTKTQEPTNCSLQLHKVLE